MVKQTKIEEKNNSIVLEDMLRCNAFCAGDFKTARFVYQEDLLEWMARNLPSLPYIVDQMVQLIFSNGLTTGDEDEDKVLDEFLYKKNIRGATNYSILQAAMRKSIVFGKHGLRWLSEEHGWINVDSRNYASLVEDNEEYYGFKDIVGYIIAFDDVKIFEQDTKSLQFDRDAFEKNGILVDPNKKLIILSKEEFVNLRLDMTKEDGESPLLSDQQRVKLLSTVYERLNYDLEYDGPGRLLFKLKDNYATGDDNELGTADVISQSKSAKDSRVSQAKAEAEQLGRQVKNSGSDSVILVSNIFEDFDHLERVTKSTEFIEWVEANEGVILSQVFGLPPALINLGEMSGNVSMEKIIDNAMLNSIIPIRERFAVQFSPILCDKLGLSKVYFDKYELSQAVSENEPRKEVVDMMATLKNSGFEELANKMGQMLDEEIDASDGQLKKLNVSGFEKLKNLFRSGK
ncbi:hypothetical protein [Enterococcus sp. DIV0800]|uniref:hypothetical protein n=1 Tax=unclassified Enterococcus TaxID=2608891 RepID=UPI003D2FAD6E